MNKKLLNLLVRSFDGELSTAEKQQLAHALKNSPALQKEKERLELLRSTLGNQPPASFGPFFPERVVNRVRAINKNGSPAQDFFDSLIFMFRRLALIAGLTACLVFSANLFINKTDVSVQTSTIDQSIEESVYSTYLVSLEEVL